MPQPQARQTGPTGPRIWLSESRDVRAEHIGATAKEQSVARTVASGQATPLSIAKGDFDSDGIDDLVVGYATPEGGAIECTVEMWMFRSPKRGVFPGDQPRRLPFSVFN